MRSFILLFFLLLSLTTLAQTPPLVGKLAVIPLQNQTNDAQLDWVGIALQDSLTIDLWYLPVGKTHPLIWYSEEIAKSCPGMSLACVQGLKQADWLKIAQNKDYSHILWGSYQQAETKEKLQIHLQWLLVESGKVVAQQHFSAELSTLTQFSGSALLELLAKHGIQASKEQQERVLWPETNKVQGLRFNALGYWTQQQYYAAEKNAKPQLLTQWGNYLHQAVAKDANYANGWNNLGWYYFVAKNSEQEEQAFRQAIAANPSQLDANDGLGSLLKKSQQWELALEVSKQTCIQGVSFPNACSNLHKIYRDQGKAEQGIAFFSRLIKQLILPNERSKQADLFWNLAVLYKQQKNWLAARNAYQQALSYYQLDSQKFSLT